jgi:hypothetical protein
MAWSAKTGEIVPTQCRAARGLLGWSRGDLAARTCLPFSWVVEFEQNIDLVSAEAIAAMRFAFEDAGIEFVPEKRNGESVRWRKGETVPIAGEGLNRTSDLSLAAKRSQS